MQASAHPRESDRIAALRSYGILDTPRSKDFDDVIETLAKICDVPIALLSLIDEERQWFKATVGYDAQEGLRSKSICAYTILGDDVLVVADTHTEKRFRDMEICQGPQALRFYAGAPLRTSDGLSIGTLCVVDYVPRDLPEELQQLLRVMADQVMRQIELRRAAVIQDQTQGELREALEQKRLLIKEIDHRVKNSLQTINSFLQLQALSAKTEAERRSLEEAEARVMTVARVHQQLYTAGDHRRVQLASFLSGLAVALEEVAEAGVRITVDSEPAHVSGRHASSVGILVNEVVSNALKYAFPELGKGGRVHITLAREGDELHLSIVDDGVGFDPAAPPRGTGVGMRIVDGMVRSLRGRLEVSSGPEGTRFHLYFPATEA